MTSYRLAENVTMQQIGEETVLLNLGLGLYYRLDETGTQILNALLQGNAQTEIVDKIVADYEVEEKTAREDVERITAELCQQGLLSV
jgi:hypothetical protein